MSTILDALKKVENERPQSARERLLHVEEPEPVRRRPLSIGVIVACATLGFAAGIGLALWRNAPSTDVPLPLDLPSAPANDVPPPPAAPPHDARVAAVPPAASSDDSAAATAEEPTHPAVETGDPAAAAGNDALARAHPDAVAPRVPPAMDGVVPAPPPAVAVAPGAAEQGSALEPSPFARGGQDPRTADAHAARAPSAPPDVPAAVAPLALAPRETDDDAIPADEPPSAEEASEDEPEPAAAAAPAPLIDTGRSPPGAPKVVLSFLQWSEEPARRFALISIDGAPSQRVREGETAGGMTVAQITPTGVQFDREGKRFTIRTRH